MTEYEYKEPEGKRYNVSIKKWNSLFGYRGRWPFLYSALWVDGDEIVIHHYYTIWAKLFVTLVYPVLIVSVGYKTANKETYRVWFNKTSGSFSVDNCCRSHVEQWKKIEQLVGEKL